MTTAEVPTPDDIPRRLSVRLASSHGSMTDDVTAVLREAILEGTLTPSTWLREQDLAASLNVSRTPVREALRRLADEHLVERVANRGCVVRGMTLDDVLAVYVVREQLEGLAARSAALQRPPGLIPALLQIHDAMVTAVREKDVARLVELNLEFHRAIRESTGNPYLERFLVQVEHAVRRFRGSTYEDPGRAEATLREHEAITRCIVNGDGEGAFCAASEHMRRAREARIAMIMSSTLPK